MKTSPFHMLFNHLEILFVSALLPIFLLDFLSLQLLYRGSLFNWKISPFPNICIVNNFYKVVCLFMNKIYSM